MRPSRFFGDQGLGGPQTREPHVPLRLFDLEEPVGNETAAAFYFVFRFGGYRALLAFVATLGVAMHVASAGGTHRVGASQLLAGLAIGLLLGALGAFIAALIPKGPYVVFAAAFACNAGNYLLSAIRAAGEN